MSRLVFYGIPAWVNGYTGSTSITWWPVDPTTTSPTYDTSKLITNDISKNPYAYNHGTITFASVKVDDAPANNGWTTVGPTWPGGTMTAAIGLESGFYNALSAGVKPSRVPPGGGGHDYEYTTVQYFAGGMSNRRFAGFYVEIQSITGTSAYCKTWAAGTGNAGGAAAGTWLFDLSANAMPIETGFTQVGVGATDPRNGALFLDSSAYTGVGLSGPKLPQSLGHSFEPR